MKYNINARNIELTQGLENAVINKSKKLDKFFKDTVEAQITLSVERQRHIVEITIPFNGQVLRAEVESDDMYSIIDDAVDIIEKQVTRFKSKLRNRSRNNTPGLFAPSFLEEDHREYEEVLNVQRRKKFAIKPMNTEEAIMQMELVGHTFYVYLDAETEEVNVVYKRKNGTYGLIEPTLDEM